jgi:ATP-dependent DNA helicase RecQ
MGKCKVNGSEIIKELSGIDFELSCDFITRKEAEQQYKELFVKFAEMYDKRGLTEAVLQAASELGIRNKLDLFFSDDKVKFMIENGGKADIAKAEDSNTEKKRQDEIKKLLKGCELSEKEIAKHIALPYKDARSYLRKLPFIEERVYYRIKEEKKVDFEKVKFSPERRLMESKLKMTFGIDHFYEEQWEAISRLRNGERILMIQRTGFGKSLCYQFPATIFPGVTIVFSPLIALMRDQVNGLKKKGISAAAINSEQSNEENEEAIERALENRIKILYITPERMENERWQEVVQGMSNVNISMIVIDEAHTISTWGHDFRPAFRKIINLVQLLPSSTPLLATTATATMRVQKDIEEQIGGKITSIRGSLSRDNFNLYVIRVKSEDEKMMWLAQNVSLLEGTGLIYTGTRLDTEIYAGWLRFVGIDAVEYNAGLDAETRMVVESSLMDNTPKCVVSTNALGMGIDKPDIRFIIHTQIPVSPIHYYQEIGRAGRDGKPTDVILFYNDTKGTDNIEADKKLPLSFINGARPTRSQYQRVIDCLQEGTLKEKDIALTCNLKTHQVRTINSDLIDQKIIFEVRNGNTKWYEYNVDAPDFDYYLYDELRKTRLKELDRMVEYVNTTLPRMEYLCSFLDSADSSCCAHCDNTDLQPLTFVDNPRLRTKLQQFRETLFTELKLSVSTWTQFPSEPDGGRVRYYLRVPYPDVIEIYKAGEESHVYNSRIGYKDFSAETAEKIRELYGKHLNNKSHITNGVAASYYMSNVATAIHHSKYENGGDYSEFLVALTLKAFRKKFGQYHYDLVLYVPPTESGDLVKNFAKKFARGLGLPVSDALKKERDTRPQKVFQNGAGKEQNVRDAFGLNGRINIRGKNVILVDDIYDSGATLKEIARMLTDKGAKYITPVVIAKTIGGTSS